jgi:hypothetical protein
MKGAAVDALEMVKEHTRSVLPSWIDTWRLPREYDCKFGLDPQNPF